MREVFEALGRRAAGAGDVVAFADGAARVTYADLAGRVAGVAEELRVLAPPSTVLGLLGDNTVDWVVGQLAAWQAGMVVVPLPAFLSAAQRRHVLADAGVGRVLATPQALDAARELGVPVTPVGQRRGAFRPSAGAGAGQIIYTSGSTGRPKGVRLSGRQIAWSGAALADASGAGPDDVYLSALPFALLLETIAGIVVPILAGGRVRLEPVLAAAAGAGRPAALAEAVARVRPSCLVLVPQLLAAWVAGLEAGGRRAPGELRFVAVGGAPVPPALAERAWGLGIPVHEGYGLSECGSVVAVNRPGQRRAGTVGKPLPGLDVAIRRGQIVVRGPSVMDGYLHGEPAGGTWRTGDLGTLDADGYLRVRGRLDNVLITAYGRNVSPEWIEAMLLADPRIAHAVVVGDGEPHLSVVLVPSPAGERWFADASAAAIRALIEAACAEAPLHAVPRTHLVLPMSTLVRQDLLTASGRVRRRALFALARPQLHAPPAADDPGRARPLVAEPTR